MILMRRISFARHIEHYNSHFIRHETHPNTFAMHMCLLLGRQTQIPLCFETAQKAKYNAKERNRHKTNGQI